ncbi:MAG: DUF3810 domain-containing protein [Oscillospiraceae bacterium]|nr:DUF3810 domain-containing protein [Oscillospiraceae bacterium]
MKRPTEKGENVKKTVEFLKLAPRRVIMTVLSAAVIIAHLLTRSDHELNVLLTERLVRPAHRFLSVTASHVPFSVAEVLVGLFVIWVAVYLISQIVFLIREGQRIRRLLLLMLTVLCVGLMIYAAFCVLWGIYYYSDDFATQSGLDAGPVEIEELRAVTIYFASLANEYAKLVPRDENGVCSFDRDAVLARSDEVYRAAEEMYPCLQAPDIRAKGVHFSRIVSYIDFTGFFFPFTAEANVNTDFPTSLFPSTVAHELAHQRGVAKEQEANFCAVLSSLEYGDPEYCYSACLLAYTHLGNALYQADRTTWSGVYSSLSEEVLTDFAANREYWKQFDTPVRKAYNTVYENFLYSFDQSYGLRSYGKCVDLLVHYYIDDARELLANPRITD